MSEDLKSWHMQELAGMYKKCLEVSLERSRKYASDEDPYLNFRRAARAVGLTPEEIILALIGTKIARLLNALEKEEDGSEYPDDSLDDTFVDLANYQMILRNFRISNRQKSRPEGEFAPVVAEEVVEVEEPGLLDRLKEAARVVTKRAKIE